MRLSVRNAVIAAFAIALVVGFISIGPLLNKLPVGLDTSAYLFGGAIQSIVLVFSPDLSNAAAGGIWLILLILGTGAAGFFLVRGAVRAKVGRVDPSRRRSLTGAGSGAGVALGSMAVGAVAGSTRFFGVGNAASPGWNGIGAAIFADTPRTHPEWKDAWKGSRIRAHRRFGRTEWNVSDIVLGTGRIHREGGEQIARQAIERGVNYFDTSPDYSGAGSEQVMGRAIAGVRDQLFIATKFCTPTGHLPPGSPVPKYIEAVEGSLARLGTDYVDLCHIHSVDTVERLMDENAHEAFDRLKEQGKVRFMGFSTHTPNLIEVANAGIDSGRFDVMMLAYHYGLWAPMGEIIRRGHAEQDMGVVAMKTLKGAKHRGLDNFQPYADAFSQASLKWALANRDVSCAVISFFELQHVDEYLAASGGVLEDSDIAILEEYDRQIAGTYCGPHCGACLSSCPEELAIHDILRHRMYFEDYGWEKEGMRLYSQLEKQADVCASCAAPCTGACPYGLPIQERMKEAHELLSLG
jgi:aryl-alcohol dehydrogenase-like predicted oxidoreductase